MAAMGAQQSLDWDDGLKGPDRLTTWPPSPDDLAAGWLPLLNGFWASESGQSLSARIAQRLVDGALIYPPKPFRALELTALTDVRVVILGQDPYHGPGQAQGLAFSVPTGVRVPPSLRNVFKELNQSLGLMWPTDGSLERWAHQGVLLLNTSLTVEDGQAASHARWGWGQLTDALISAAAQSAKPVVFMLWGAHAQAKKELIDTVSQPGRHLVLQANHPSPLSAMRPPAPFLGCGHFAKANDFLARSGQKTINW